MNRLLDPGLELTLRPMQYPQFYEMYLGSVKNTWTVEELDFQTDIKDLGEKVTAAERHMIQRLVAFFATGDTIVANNLVLGLYGAINSPEARMYLSRQLAEEALHIQFYLTMLDNYIPEPEQRAEAFKAVHTIPSIKMKADFCMRNTRLLESASQRPDLPAYQAQLIRNIVAYACCVEGLFFFGAFAYVFYLRSKGLFQGLGTGTNLTLKDEACHMMFGFEVLRIVKQQQPELFDDKLEADVRAMLAEAIDCEAQFADDLLQFGVTGMSPKDMRTYLEYLADQRLDQLGYKPQYGSQNPFPFIALQDMPELANFFERRVSAYQKTMEGEFSLEETDF